MKRPLLLYLLDIACSAFFFSLVRCSLHAVYFFHQVEQPKFVCASNTLKFHMVL